MFRLRVDKVSVIDYSTDFEDVPDVLLSIPTYCNVQASSAPSRMCALSAYCILGSELSCKCLEHSNRVMAQTRLAFKAAELRVAFCTVMHRLALHIWSGVCAYCKSCAEMWCVMLMLARQNFLPGYAYT